MNIPDDIKAVVRAALAEINLCSDGYCFCPEITGPAAQCSWCDLTQATRALSPESLKMIEESKQ